MLSWSGTSSVASEHATERNFSPPQGVVDLDLAGGLAPIADVVPERRDRRSVGMEKSEMTKERLLAALDNSALALDTVEGGLVALGHNSLSANTTGSSAVTVGANAGATNTTGNYNTFIVFAGSG